MPSLILRLAAVCLLVSPLLAACGGDDSASNTPGVTTQTPNAFPSVGGPQNQPAPPQELDSEPVEASNGVIEIAASGTLFQQNYLHLNVGDAVTIRLTNQDSTPHNLRIAGLDGQFNTEDDAVTSPDQVDPGQSGELTFAPPAAGVYTFHCDFHPTLMGGEIVVGDATPIPAAAAPTDTPEDTTSQ